VVAARAAAVLAAAGRCQSIWLENLPHGPSIFSAFAGQTVVIRFRAATDVSLVTTFRIDDVSVK
jgi:hypothetical protein